MPMPCPYLTGKVERKIFTELPYPDPGGVNEAMNRAGFRRSQGISYRPVCENCRSCISVRVPVADFTPSESLRRISRRNQNLSATVVATLATDEQYGLFQRYLITRHRDAGMDGMSPDDYAEMIESCTADSFLIEYRLAPTAPGRGGPLIATMVFDQFSDGISLIYSFFDPEMDRLSLGTFMILDQIGRAKARELSFVYLGYWIRQSDKMSYKARFRPLEGFIDERWVPMGLDVLLHEKAAVAAAPQHI